MKLTFLKLRTNAQLKKNKSQRANVPYAEAKNIGIIFTIDDRTKHEAVKDFMHKLEQNGKKVQVMAFMPDKKENFDFMFDFFNSDEISFWGVITSPGAIRFSTIPFDYLICLDTDPNPIILNLLARSNAKCRVGRYNEDKKPYFEFMIDSVGQTKGLAEGIYQYTTQMK
jgi:hypothetical protein